MTVGRILKYVSRGTGIAIILFMVVSFIWSFRCLSPRRPLTERDLEVISELFRFSIPRVDCVKRIAITQWHETSVYIEIEVSEGESKQIRQQIGRIREPDSMPYAPVGMPSWYRMDESRLDVSYSYAHFSKPQNGVVTILAVTGEDGVTDEKRFPKEFYSLFYNY